MAKLIPKLQKFFTTQSRYKILYGGRASGKSYSVAEHLVRLTASYKLKVMCIRQFQSNIKESVYSLLKDIIYKEGFKDEFEVLSTTIRHKITGSEFIFYGVNRNFMEIKSTEGVDILYSEESHGLTKEQWDVINPTIRKEHSEIFLLFNPQHRGDFVWQRFVEKPHEDSLVLKLNYTENPYLSETMKRVIAEAKTEDEEEYEHIYLGVPREGDDKALLTYAEVEYAMNDNLDGVDKSGIFSYGVDVARYGSDKGCLTKRRGYHIYGLKSYNKYSTMELANAVSNEVSQEDKRPNAIFVDTIGVGAGVYDRLEEKGFNSIDSNASMKADSNDIYVNKRAEMYFLLRDFIRKGGKIPNDKELKEELLAIRYIYSKVSGKIQIQSKDEIKDLIGRSPDKADSVALHFFSEVRIEKSDFVNISKRAFMRNRRR